MAVSVDGKTLGIVKIFVGSPSSAAARTQFAALTADQRLLALKELQSDAKYGAKIEPVLNGLRLDPSMGTAAQLLHAQLFAAASTNIPDNISRPLAGMSRDVADIAKSIDSLKTSFEEPNGIRGQVEKAKDLAKKAKADIDADPELAGDNDLKAAASSYGAVIVEIDDTLQYLETLSSGLAGIMDGFKVAVASREEYLFDDKQLATVAQPASGNIEKRFGSANKTLNLGERINQFAGMIKNIAAAQVGGLVNVYNGAVRAYTQLKENNQKTTRQNEEKKVRYEKAKDSSTNAGATDAELAKIDGKIAALLSENTALSDQQSQIDTRINDFGQKLIIAVKSANELSDIIMTSHSASSVSLKDKLVELTREGKKAEQETADTYIQYYYRGYTTKPLDKNLVGFVNVDPEQIPEAVRIIDDLAKSPAGTGKIVCLSFVVAYAPASQVTASREDETIGNFDGLELDTSIIQIYAASAGNLNEVFKTLAGNTEWQAIEAGVSQARRDANPYPYQAGAGSVFRSLSLGVKPVEPPKADPRTKMFEQVWQELAGINANNFGDVMRAEAGKDTGSIKTWLEGIQKKLQVETIGNVPITGAYSNFAEGIMSLWKNLPGMTANALVANIEAMILAIAFYSIRSYLERPLNNEIIKGDPQDQARVQALAETVEAFLKKQRFGDLQGKDLFAGLAAQIISYYEDNKTTVKSDDLKNQIIQIIFLMMDKKSKEQGLSNVTKDALNRALENLTPKKSGVVS